MQAAGQKQQHRQLANIKQQHRRNFVLLQAFAFGVDKNRQQIGDDCGPHNHHPGAGLNLQLKQELRGSDGNDLTQNGNPTQ